MLYKLRTNTYTESWLWRVKKVKRITNRKAIKEGEQVTLSIIGICLHFYNIGLTYIITGIIQIDANCYCRYDD